NSGLMARQISGKAERGSRPRLLDGCYAREAGDEGGGGVTEDACDLEARGLSLAKRVEFTRQGCIDIVSKPPNLPISGPTQEEPRRCGSARFVHGHETPAFIAGEQRLNMEPHQILIVEHAEPTLPLWVKPSFASCAL